MANVSLFFEQLIDLSRNSSLIESKRRAIANIGSRMQYNLPTDRGRKQSEIKGKIEIDAVDVILDALVKDVK